MILLTDTNSRIPVTIQPSGQHAILAGDNIGLPLLEFLETPELVRPGDRVVSSGDGGVFPAGLLVGQVVAGADRRLRVRLAADYERLEFLRVLRSHDGRGDRAIRGGLVAPAHCRPPRPWPRQRAAMADPVTAERWRYHAVFVAVSGARWWSRCCRSARHRRAGRGPTCLRRWPSPGSCAGPTTCRCCWSPL